MTDSITPILYSRFVLNLRQVDHPSSISSRNVHLSRLSMPSFVIPGSRITGNLGEDLRDFTSGAEGFDEHPAEGSLQSDLNIPSQVGEVPGANTGVGLHQETPTEMVRKFCWLDNIP